MTSKQNKILQDLRDLNIKIENYSNEFSISLSYNVYPTYNIKLPKTIDISDEDFYQIYAKECGISHLIIATKDNKYTKEIEIVVK